MILKEKFRKLAFGKVFKNRKVKQKENHTNKMEKYNIKQQKNFKQGKNKNSR